MNQNPDEGPRNPLAGDNRDWWSAWTSHNAGDDALSPPENTQDVIPKKDESLSASLESELASTGSELDSIVKKNIPSNSDKITLITIAGHHPFATDHINKHPMNNVGDLFTTANILHTDRCVAEASKFYRMAFDLHDKSPHNYPLSHSLLQARLLCLLKSGEPLPADELEELRSISIPFAHYIEGVSLAWRNQMPFDALRKIGNAFEEFHTGEEIDSIYLETARSAGIPFFFSKNNNETNHIPQNLFMYWDQNPPEEIKENFEYHSKILGINLLIFDKAMAQEWLYQNYGVEAREIFLKSRHPAEAADFLRVHVIQMLGGWWLDADIRLKPKAVAKITQRSTYENVFFLTNNNVVHNDFFGSVAGSTILSDCLLSLYRNSYLHSGLFIAYKTGPGVFNRALSRAIHRKINGNQNLISVELLDDVKFSDHIEEFDTPYKHNLPSWYTA